MSQIKDGPASALFSPLALKGNTTLPDLEGIQVSETLRLAASQAPSGACVSWGIPFEIGDVFALTDSSIRADFSPIKARWLVFLHTSDVRSLTHNQDGFISPMRGAGQLAEHAADYVMQYADDSEIRAQIRRRHQVGAIGRGWGENCFEAVAHHKPYPVRAAHEQVKPGWGWSQVRGTAADESPWVNWLWAWENPQPEKELVGIRFEPVSGLIIVSAVTVGQTETTPLRWNTRQKACWTLPAADVFKPDLDQDGLLSQIQLDLGQVISALPRLIYPHERWSETYNNQLPSLAKNEILIEYTAHPEALFHFSSGESLPVARLEAKQAALILQPVSPAQQEVKLRIVDKSSRKPVSVKLHVHGPWGEYLAPVDRHRILNPAWFEDYSVDFAHITWSQAERMHSCTYIRGETVLILPLGSVYLEVSKGFEIRPVRQVFEIGPSTREIVLEVEKVLPWREKGWVTADTHVHFLSPVSALLEGAAEGVNVINLLASQWGELMTNVGDFDGQTTWGARGAGGEGEYLVRVGTENRQHVMGHISLLGYSGSIIAPMTSGGMDESALGDPVDILLTEWARQCKQQGGLVVLPHFPNPRAEHAASIISGDIDAVEMTSWENLYGGIDPYSLSDWYRYLNCGYFVPAVGGTDKMTAATAVGTVRTYAHLASQVEFTYQAWMESVRRGETFVTYGPLLEFAVEGRPMGSRMALPASGGTLDVLWQVSSVTIPVSRVELVVNGTIQESQSVSDAGSGGHWTVKVDKSSWLAVLVRGHYTDQPEIVAAHSSPVMVQVEGSPMLASADAVTILEQIEGALAYLDTVGTRAEDRAYKRMRLVLESSHRTLHNRLHELGYYHGHSSEPVR